MKKLSKRIKSVGLLANTEKSQVKGIIAEAARLIRRSGRTVLTDPRTSGMALGKTERCPDGPTLARMADLLLVFGGDGTMLRVVREIDGAATPILGINAGRLGFLTAVPSQDLAGALKKIWSGDFFLEDRPLIEASGQGAGKPLLLRALNDIVISRGGASRMIDLDVSVNGEALTCYRSDGLIISTPTGSTAYSLSAGGAIVSPAAEVFAMTPICPHTLSNRSVIVSLRSTIQVRVMSENLEVNASADGQVQVDLAENDMLTVKRSERFVRLLHLGGASFFGTLRQKLHWSGSNF